MVTHEQLRNSKHLFYIKLKEEAGLLCTDDKIEHWLATLSRNVFIGDQSQDTVIVEEETIFDTFCM